MKILELDSRKKESAVCDAAVEFLEELF